MSAILSLVARPAQQEALAIGTVSLPPLPQEQKLVRINSYVQAQREFNKGLNAEWKEKRFKLLGPLRKDVMRLPNALAYGGVGAAIGAAAGSPVFLAGAGPGAAFGFFIGFLLGLSPLGEGLTNAIADPIARSKWKSQIKNESPWRASEAIKDFLLKDPTLADIVCPLKGGLPVIPVRSPTGRVYDMELLMAHLSLHHTEPGTNDHLEVSDLVFAFEIFPQAFSRLTLLLKRDADFVKKRLDRGFKKGIDELINSLKTANDDYHVFFLVQLKQLRRERKITSEQNRKLCDYLTRVFDPGEDTPYDIDESAPIEPPLSVGILSMEKSQLPSIPFKIVDGEEKRTFADSGSFYKESDFQSVDVDTGYDSDVGIEDLF